MVQSALVLILILPSVSEGELIGVVQQFTKLRKEIIMW